MTRRERCDRVHSALTEVVGWGAGREVTVHAVCERFVSGQLPFLGLTGKSHEYEGTDALSYDLNSLMRPYLLRNRL